MMNCKPEFEGNDKEDVMMPSAGTLPLAAGQVAPPTTAPLRSLSVQAPAEVRAVWQVQVACPDVAEGKSSIRLILPAEWGPALETMTL